MENPFEEYKKELDAELERYRQVLKAQNHDHFLTALVEIESQIEASRAQAQSLYDEYMKKAEDAPHPAMARLARRRAEILLQFNREATQAILARFMEAAPPSFRIVG